MTLTKRITDALQESIKAVPLSMGPQEEIGIMIARLLFENATLKGRLEEAESMLLDQAQTIKKYQNASVLKETNNEPKAKKQR